MNLLDDDGTLRGGTESVELQLKCGSFSGKCALSFNSVWGVEQDVIHHTSWLGSTQENVVCHKTKLVKLLLEEEPNTAVGNLDQTEKSVAP